MLRKQERTKRDANMSAHEQEPWTLPGARKVGVPRAQPPAGREELFSPSGLQSAQMGPRGSDITRGVRMRWRSPPRPPVTPELPGQAPEAKLQAHPGSELPSTPSFIQAPSRYAHAPLPPDRGLFGRQGPCLHSTS